MDRWTDIATRAERRQGIVSIDDLVRGGATRSQVKRWEESGRLVSTGYGAFRVGGAPESYDALVLAAIESYPQFTWASHRTVARLLDLGIACSPGLVEVTRPTGLSAERGMALVHRSTRIPDHHRTTVRGIPCLTVARTLFDLARTTPAPVLLRAVDRGLIRALCTESSIWRVFHDLGGRGRPGTARMREVLESLASDHVPPASELEEVGMAFLAGRGFDWQVVMTDERGYIRRVDGLRREDRVIVEFDGPQHGREPQRSLDREGDRRLGELGFEVVRLRWSDVTLAADASLAALERAAERHRA